MNAVPTGPRIGSRRVYTGHELPLLYPGEHASATLDSDAIARTIAEAHASGQTQVRMPVAGWLVEPMPGWHGWFLRWRYRLVGRWRHATIKVEAIVEASDD